MFRKILIVVLLFALLLTSCTQYVFDFDDWFNNLPEKEITIDEIARGINQEKLNEDIKAEIEGTKDVPGLIATAKTERPRTLNTSVLQSKALVPSTIYFIVEFDNYESSNNTVISSGSMLLEAIGLVQDDSTISLKTYSAITTSPMVTTTSSRGQYRTENVSISIPSATISGSVTISENGSIDNITITISTPEEHSGSTITIGNTEIPMDQVSGGISEGFNGMFAGGYGTAENPYEISNARQFLNLGNEDVQELIKNNNDGLYFELIKDIDLRNHTGYAARFISGTLDGNNHRIICGDGMPFMFEYSYEDMTFEDINIEFGEGTVTRLFTYPAISSEGSVYGLVNTGAGNDNLYLYDKPSMNLTFNNVDFIAPGNTDYIFGDNNFALYISNIGAFDIFVDEELYYSSLPAIYTSGDSDTNREFLDFNVTLENCDVSGNFIGGFGGSGAAIFTGGQFLGAHVKLENCNYDGTIEGLNVSMVVANSSGCNTLGSSIEAVNVTGGTVIAYSGRGSLSYANSNEEIPGVSGEYIGADGKSEILVNNSALNDVLEITGIQGGTDVNYYEIKLFLPSMFWYDNINDTEWTARTDSNTFTIKIAPDILESSEIYIAKVLSKTDADNLAPNNPLFADIPETSWDRTSGSFPYAFIKDSETSIVYMVIDYSPLIRMYSDDGAVTSVDELKYPSRLIILARNSNDGVVGVSDAIDIK